MVTDIPPDAGIMVVMELLIEEILAADPDLHDRLIARVEALLRSGTHQEHQDTFKLTLLWLTALRENEF